MKKFFGILTLIFLITITACDDGEMTVKSFNFTGSVSKCGTVENLYIKSSGTEALLMNLSTHPLLNIASELDENGAPIPTIVNLPTGAVIYRNYSGTASSGVVCSTVDNPDVYVLEEWTGSGTVEIITTKLPVTTAGLISYSHTITFLDVSLTKGDETIRIQNTDYGTVTTNLSFEFEFASGDDINPTHLSDCNGNFIYDTHGDEALLLYFASGTLTGIVDETIVPLNDTNNFLTLKVYSSSVGTSTICSDNQPTTPSIKERWDAIEGRVKIKKTVDGGVVHYDFYLYNDIIFYNNTSTAVATEFFTPVPTGNDADGDYYYLGQYYPL